VHLGTYRFSGDPSELVAAYDRLMATMPLEQVTLHVCVVDADGITIYDTCPTEEVFARFSTDPAVRSAFAAAGLPEPEVHGRPVHNAVVDGAPFPAA